MEDDYLVAGEVRDLLHEKFVNLVLTEIATEVDFVAALPDLEGQLPDLVIMDIMIPWQRPSLNVIAPTQNAGSDPLNSGIRLLRRMADNSRLKTVPIIIHSARERQDIEPELSPLPDHVIFVHKGVDASQLMVVLRALMAALGRLPEERRRSVRERIIDAIHAIPNVGGFGVDLRKLLMDRTSSH